MAIALLCNGSLSYTPILLLEPKTFRGVLDFEDHLFVTKYLIKHPVVYFLSSESTLNNSSDIYVIKHIITKTILLWNKLS